MLGEPAALNRKMWGFHIQSVNHVWNLLGILGEYISGWKLFWNKRTEIWRHQLSGKHWIEGMSLWWPVCIGILEQPWLTYCLGVTALFFSCLLITSDGLGRTLNSARAQPWQLQYFCSDRYLSYGWSVQSLKKIQTENLGTIVSSGMSLPVIHSIIQHILASVWGLLSPNF